jgi:Zn finger protein HypA/HybF involved in hydrogenase expression
VHEISLIQNLLEVILQEIETNHNSLTNIKGLALTVGALELHSEDAFRQAFATESRGTVLEGVSLELTIVPAIVQCPK